MQGGYPARLKKVLIVTAPLWFKAPFKILRLFVREKLRERVFTVSVPQLSLHVPRENLPIHLGGSLEINHSSWLSHCCKSMTNREDDLFNHIDSEAGGGYQSQQQLQQNHIQYKTSIPASTSATLATAATATTNATNSSTANECSTSNGTVKMVCVDEKHLLDNQNSNQQNHTNGDASNNAVAVGSGNGDAGQLSDMWSENPPSSASSGFSDDDSLEGDPKTIEQVLEMVRERGRVGLTKEYTDIRSRAPDGTFTHARIRTNLAKNRYTDVLCFDHTRVILSVENEEPTSDYINANFVDGYKQKNAYISTQGMCKMKMITILF